MKMTSAYASKLLKQLDEEKEYLLSMEKSGSTYIAASREEGLAPEYDYNRTEQKLEAINETIMKIKHAVNVSNTQARISIGEAVFTVDEILVRMAQLNKRKGILDTMRKMRDGKREGRGLFDTGNMVQEYRFLNFSRDDVQRDYERVSAEIMQMQLALDRHNQVDEFEADVEI